jgi:tachykinin-like receptor
MIYYYRYVAIVYPLTPRMTQKKALSIILTIWLCASLFALPTLLFSRTQSYDYAEDQIRTLCIMIWPDGGPGQSHFDNV